MDLKIRTSDINEATAIMTAGYEMGVTVSKTEIVTESNRRGTRNTVAFVLEGPVDAIEDLRLQWINKQLTGNLCAYQDNFRRLRSTSHSTLDLTERGYTNNGDN